MQISTQKYMQNRSINEKTMTRGQDLSEPTPYEPNQIYYRTLCEDDPLLVLTAESQVREGKFMKHKNNEHGKQVIILSNLLMLVFKICIKLLQTSLF